MAGLGTETPPAPSAHVAVSGAEETSAASVPLASGSISFLETRGVIFYVVVDAVAEFVCSFSLTQPPVPGSTEALRLHHIPIDRKEQFVGPNANVIRVWRQDGAIRQIELACEDSTGRVLSSAKAGFPPRPGTVKKQTSRASLPHSECDLIRLSWTRNGFGYMTSLMPEWIARRPPASLPTPATRHVSPAHTPAPAHPTPGSVVDGGSAAEPDMPQWSVHNRPSPELPHPPPPRVQPSDSGPGFPDGVSVSSPPADASSSSSTWARVRRHARDCVQHDPNHPVYCDSCRRRVRFLSVALLFTIVVGAMYVYRTRKRW
jgi:hypothetical protein